MLLFTTYILENFQIELKSCPISKLGQKNFEFSKQCLSFPISFQIRKSGEIWDFPATFGIFWRGFPSSFFLFSLLFSFIFFLPHLFLFLLLFHFPLSSSSLLYAWCGMAWLLATPLAALEKKTKKEEGRGKRRKRIDEGKKRKEEAQVSPENPKLAEKSQILPENLKYPWIF